MSWPLFFLIIQTLILWILVFVFHRLKNKYTLVPVYSFIAVTTFLAQHLPDLGFAVTVGGWYFLIGSVSFFSTVILAILMLYLLEGPREARLGLGVVIFTTIFYSALLFFLSQEVDTTNWVEVSFKNSYFEFWSIVVTIVDVFFMAIVWELLARIKKIPLLIRVFLVVLGTFELDALLFVNAVYWGDPIYWSLLKGVLLTRLLMAVVAAPMISFSLNLEGFREEIRRKPKEFWEILNFKSDLERKISVMEETLEDEEKQADDLRKFKLAVQNASDHIIITDPEGIILYANPAVQKITGFSNEEVLGKKAGSKELWGGLMAKSFYEKMWKTIKIEKKDFGGEIRNKRKNGEEYVALAKISPVLNDDGEVVFFVGIERDITKEKEIDRMKTEFISLASHQLRTPLSAMKWFLEILLSGDAGKLNKEQKEMVTNIDESNERMIALVNALLNVSRIESGRMMVEPEPTDLKNVVESVKEELQPELKAKKMKIEIEAKKMGKINVDPKLIAEVYKNLMTNAVRYSKDGGVIKVRVFEKGENVVSEVVDRGIGIPKTEQSKIFGKFFRAENAVKKTASGTGLGLYLTKLIVDASGGKIGFTSEENKGTTFWFSLPKSGSKAKKGEVSISSVEEIKNKAKGIKA